MVTPDKHLTCDLFCRVIDNYGDIGVCWRLARQLHDEHDWRVRLWVDDIAVCAQLTQNTNIAGIDVCEWHTDFPAVMPADVVIEAFACELPESYLQAMTTLEHAPVWLNLEYLCVESWGAGIHLQPSPHPRLPLTKYFFVPGILPGTAGVLKEADLLARQASIDVEAARRQYTDNIEGRWVFLFCYENPALPMLLDVWAASAEPVHCLVAAGKAHTQVSAWLGEDLSKHARRGNLDLYALPFVAQRDFDDLLWTCDLNFVRGEDSFCRALWAAKPFIWHIYPQDERAHWTKLAEFQAHYTVPTALTALSSLWNGIITPELDAVAHAWHQLDTAWPMLQAWSAASRNRLDALGNLAGNLAFFCKNR
ncbi:MAG TPA: elongation factor P maturation arginine rhamnosyltransferase EarP [Rhodocyclaceae bacterium]|nr:elongation factor P maturation arginine rhamnosyltransferase EarP [Rhodocyclaceae bacterium]